MGGFMPTPAAPAQPPTVKLDTTALSRGNFNNFLKNMSGASSLNPPIAPQMGAMMSPSLAPTMSGIDIFNPPMQMMQEGGFVDDFGDVPGDTSDPSIGDTEDRSESDDFQDALDSIDLGSSDDSMFSDDPSSATPMGLEMPSTQNFGSRITTSPISGFDTNTINELKSEINSRNEIAISEEDDFYEGNKLTPAGQTELSNRNAADLAAVMSGEIPASTFISAGSASDILGDRDVQDALSLSNRNVQDIDVFENIIDRNFARSLPGVNLPIVDSTRNTVKEDQAKALINLVGDRDTTVSDALQQNVKEQQEALAAQRGRALGPIQFGDDLANFQERLEPFESSRVGDDFDTALDIQDRIDKDRGVQELLDRGVRAEQDKVAASQAMGVGIPPTSTRRDGLSEGEIDQDESIRTMSPGESRARFGGGLGEIVSGLEDGFQKDIVELANRKPSINVSGILGKALNLPETFSRDRMVDALTTNRGKRLFGGTYEPKPIYQDGKIVGIKDQFGNLMEGIDPFAPDTGSNENEDPVIRPIIPIKKEEETKSSAPNVFGGSNPFLPPQSPVVVDSPFTTNVGDFKGTGFSTGDLNRLIAQLTGIRSPRSMAKGGVAEFADGGLIKAVDDFLSTGQ